MTSPRSACVVVLGDISRSPRMRYHCHSLVSEQFSPVVVIAYPPSGGEDPFGGLGTAITFRPIKEYQPPRWLPRCLVYILKVIYLAFVLFLSLIRHARPCSVVLVQNPPALPTLPVCGLFSWLFGKHLIVDFHNYAYTIMALSLPKKHPFVRLTKVFEGWVARRASANFAVSRALKADLENSYGVSPDATTVLYDRPREIFRKASVDDSHRVFVKLAEQWQCFRGKGPNKSAFTEQQPSETASWLTNRPVLVVSSTSWTPDEDFGVLFDALQMYEDALDQQGDLRPLVCAITGRGPLRQDFLDKVKAANWHHISIAAPWLSFADYATLVGSADFGVCCHCSSSGLDLPMKVVDMFGACLPVSCAGMYPSLTELVKPEINGLIFTNSSELLEHLYLLSQQPDKIAAMRKNLEVSSRLPMAKWHSSWRMVALPVLEEFVLPPLQQ